MQSTQSYPVTSQRKQKLSLKSGEGERHANNTSMVVFPHQRFFEYIFRINLTKIFQGSVSSVEQAMRNFLVMSINTTHNHNISQRAIQKQDKCLPHDATLLQLRQTNITDSHQLKDLLYMFQDACYPLTLLKP